MSFDLEGARRAGAGDRQIAEFLAPRHGFDLDGARRAGASDQRIAEFLAAKEPQAPAPQAEPEPESTVGGEFVKGLKSGALLIPQAAYGVTRWGLDVVGADTTVADQHIERLAERQAEVAPAVGSYTEVDSFGEGARYLAHGLGQTLPLMATTMATGLVGGVVARGSAVTAAKASGAIDLMGVATAEATKQIARKTALGTAAGSFAGSLPISLGSIEADQSEQGLHKPWQALAFATPAAALDVATNLLVLSKLPIMRTLQELPLLKTKEGQGWFARGLQAAVKAAGVEGATEFVQELLERGGADRSMIDAEAMEQGLNGAILGAVSGGLIGGGAASFSRGPKSKADTGTDLTRGEDQNLTEEVKADLAAAKARGAGLEGQPAPVASPQGPVPEPLRQEAIDAVVQPAPPVQPVAAPVVEQAPPSPPPQQTVPFGPAGEQTYREALRRGASQEQAERFAMRADEVARRAEQFQAVPEAAALMQEEAPPPVAAPPRERLRPGVRSRPAPEWIVDEFAQETQAEKYKQRGLTPKVRTRPAPAWLVDEFAQEIRAEQTARNQEASFPQRAAAVRAELRRAYGPMVDEYTDQEIMADPAVAPVEAQETQAEPVAPVPMEQQAPPAPVVEQPAPVVTPPKPKRAQDIAREKKAKAPKAAAPVPVPPAPPPPVVVPPVATRAKRPQSDFVVVPEPDRAYLPAPEVVEGASRGQSLLGYLKSKGGLRDRGGELKSLGLHRARPGIMSAKGLFPDKALDAAREAGFFSDVAEADVSMDTLYEAIRKEIAGQPVLRDDPGMGWFSRNPEGYTGPQAANIIRRAREGKPLSPKQHALVARAIEEAKDQAESALVGKKETVYGADLNVGDAFNIHGEKYKVTKMEGDTLTIKNGETHKVNAFDGEVEIDAGTMEKGKPPAKPSVDDLAKQQLEEQVRAQNGGALPRDLFTGQVDLRLKGAKPAESTPLFGGGAVQAVDPAQTKAAVERKQRQTDIEDAPDPGYTMDPEYDAEFSLEQPATKLNPAAATRIRAAIDQALKGLPVSLKIVPTIDPATVPGSDAAYAAHGVASGRVAGVAQTGRDMEGTLRSLITLALDGATEATGYHEILHVAEAHGLIPKADLAILDRQYPATAKSGTETRADAAARWMMGERNNIPAQVQGVFRRLRQVLARIANALRGLGYRNADDVFQDLFSGKLAKQARAQAKPDPLANAKGPLAPSYSLAADPDLAPAGQVSRWAIRERLLGLANRFDAVVSSPLMSVENADKYRARRYRTQGYLSKIGEQTRALLEAFHHAKGADAKAIYDFFLDADADPMTIPEKWRQASIDAKRMIENIGDMLASEDYALIPQDVIDANRGQYLPRVYLKHILGEEGSSALGNGKGLSRMGYAKARLKLTEEQRLAYGEVTDPAYLVSRAFNLPMRDMAILDWLKFIARQAEWVAPGWLVEWAWSENAGYRIGSYSCRVNEDGTFDVSRTKRSVKTFEHKNLSAADVTRLFGSEKVTAAMVAGKGKPVTEKIGTDLAGAKILRETPWKRLSNIYTYRVNADGTFTVKAKEVVQTQEAHQNVTAEGLDAVMGEEKANAMREHLDVGRRVASVDSADWNKGKAKEHPVGKQVRNKPRLDGGQLVTPYWLKKSAQEIRERALKMPAEKRPAMLRIAERMDEAAAPFDAHPPLPEGWTQLPKTRKYGPLAGMVVRKQIADDLVGTFTTTSGDAGAGAKIYRAARVAHQFFKWSKTAANPAGQMRNFVSNYIALAMNGTSPGFIQAAKVMAQAAREIRMNGARWQMAKQFGVKEATFANTELMYIEREFREMLNRQGDLGYGGKAMLFLAQLQDVTGKLYQGSEALFKTASMIDSMDRLGMTPEQAALRAHDTLFDYSDVNPTVRAARTSPLGLPFITYTVKIAPALLRSMVEHPTRWLPVIGTAVAMPYVLAGMMDAEEEDYEALLKNMPEWVEEKGHAYILPIQDADGRWKPVDVGYFFPWSQWYDALRAVGRLIGPDRDLEDAAQIAGNLGFSGAPLYDIVSVWKTGIDPFTQRPVADKYAPASEQFLAYMAYVWNMATPSLVNMGGKGVLGKASDAVTGKLDAQGRPRSSATDALGRLVGVNMYAYDAIETRTRRIAAMEREVADLQGARNRRLRDPNSADNQEAIIANFQQRIDRVIDKMNRYVQESETPLAYRRP